jgi:hypothetical protein
VVARSSLTLPGTGPVRIRWSPDALRPMLDRDGDRRARGGSYCSLDHDLDARIQCNSGQAASASVA